MKFEKEPFIGRAKEVSVLEERFREGRSQLIVVYGRRRVGKSALIRSFANKKRTLFHVGDRSTKNLQIKKILEAASDAFKTPLLREIQVDEWHRLFEILTPHFLTSKTVVVFDEFQWMCESSPELPSVIQQFWDRSWEKSKSVYLILCGSYVGFMEREVLGKKSPLFGRRTAQIWLQPFSYKEARLFHPDQKCEDVAKIFGVCGGIPAYLLSFDENRSIEENLLREGLEDEGRLREEPRFLMMEELRKPAIYYALLESLQTKRLGLKDLADNVKVDKGSLVYYLNTLQNLGYVEKVIPLGSLKGDRARGRYQIKDPLLRFWFSLVYPYLTDLTLREPREVFLLKVKPRLDAFWGKQFEVLCRSAAPFLLKKSRITASFRVGSYWDSQIQIDVVVDRDDDVTHLGECKWDRHPVGMEVVNELRRKMELFPNPKRKKLIPQIYSRAGFTKAVLSESHLQLFTLKDLYSV